MNPKILMLLAPEDGGAAGGTEGAAGSIVEDPKGGKGDTGTPEGGSIIDGAGKKGEEKAGGEPKGQETAGDLKLKLPEGVDAKVAEPYMALAKKHGLKQEAAQEVFDLAFKAGNDGREALEKDIASTWEKTQETWLNEARTDKEIGGDRFKESVALADKFVIKFGGDKLMTALRESGLGKHPDVIRAFAKAGKAISEDSIAGTTGGKGGSGKVSQKAALKAEFPASPEMWEHLPDE